MKVHDNGWEHDRIKERTDKDKITNIQYIIDSKTIPQLWLLYLEYSFDQKVFLYPVSRQEHCTEMVADFAVMIVHYFQGRNPLAPGPNNPTTRDSRCKYRTQCPQKCRKASTRNVAQVGPWFMMKRHEEIDVLNQGEMKTR